MKIGNMVISSESRTEKAFEAFCREPAVSEAIVRASNDLPVALVRAAWMDGAKFATDRCKAAGHH